METETKEKIKKLVTKVFIKFHRYRVPYIKNMASWVKDQKVGDYSNDMWVRATMDILFTNSTGKIGGSGDWFPSKNFGKPIDEIVNLINSYWDKKFLKTDIK